MPYYISDTQDECTGWAMLKENDDGSYEMMACHTTKQDAIDHMIAAAVNTDGEAMGELNSRNEIRQVNMTPPAYMRTAARRGVKLHEEGLSGDGIRPQTVEDARKMAAGTVTEEKWRKIGPWIARHMVDLDAVQGDEITAGLVAHLLWGSGPTKEDARRAMEHANSVVARLDEEREATVMSDDMETDERPELGVSALRVLPESYQEATEEGKSCGTCTYFDAERKYCNKYEAGCQANMVCESWEAPGSDDDEPSVEIEVPLIQENHWVVEHGEKRSVAYSNLELRAEGDGKTLVGYAAVFDSPSEPLPWTEFVRSGAFTKTIKDGADVRLLIDHEGVPLARTKSGTLKLNEDETGLRIEASLDDANPDAAKLLSAMRRGDISQMSFAFETVKDAWSDDRRTRELREVRLYDVSVVTYPAYEQTMVQLRNKQSDNTDAATLKSPSLALRRAQLAIQRHKTSRSSADTGH